MANEVFRDWNFCAVVEVHQKVSSRVDEVGNWFESDLEWSYRVAYGCDEREIRREDFDFVWFEDKDGMIVIDGFINKTINRDSAIERALSVFAVLRSHSSNVITEFYGRNGDMLPELSQPPIGLNGTEQGDAGKP